MKIVDLQVIPFRERRRHFDWSRGEMGPELGELWLITTYSTDIL